MIIASLISEWRNSSWRHYKNMGKAKKNVNKVRKKEKSLDLTEIYFYILGWIELNILAFHFSK